MAETPQIDVAEMRNLQLQEDFYTRSITQVVGWFTIGVDRGGAPASGRWLVTVPIDFVRIGLDRRPYRAIYGDGICPFAA